MTIKRKITLAAGLASATALVALCLAQAPNAQAQAKGQGVTVSGALYGNLTADGWRANVNFQIGDELLPAVILDSGVDGKHWHKNAPASGAWSGNEHWVVTFYDPAVGTFELDAHYQASIGSAPGLATLHETGSIVNRTGRFKNATGQLSIQGPFTWQRWDRCPDRTSDSSSGSRRSMEPSKGCNRRRSRWKHRRARRCVGASGWASLKCSAGALSGGAPTSLNRCGCSPFLRPFTGSQKCERLGVLCGPFPFDEVKQSGVMNGY